MITINSRPALVMLQRITLACVLGYPMLASGEAPDNRTARVSQPVVSQQTVNRVRPPRVDVSSRHPSDLIRPEPVEWDHCSELADIAIAEGHSPADVCSESLDLVATFTPTTETEEEIEPASPNETLEDVLFVHGFSASAGTAFVDDHDCIDYWGEQEGLIEAANTESHTVRQGVLIGWYSQNDTESCEVNLPDDNPSDPSPDPLDIGSEFNAYTPLVDVAYELKRWIFDNYTKKGDSVDIVAHSLGGIVVRLMLDRWGQELLVTDVVTLGTPHNGVVTAHLLPFCWAFNQCVEVGAGSDFITNLAPNPQSVIATQWTLIAAADDQVIGEGTGLIMDDSNGGPKVQTVGYLNEHRHNCAFGFDAVGHGDLHGDNASLTVYECNVFGFPIRTVPNPTTETMNALN